ncbi:MAG: tRNA-dihydrouridine synthase [bacterium]
MARFECLLLRGRQVRPALLCAPMCGLTHSAFRRLVADFGGYGALFTEMLSGDAVLHEDVQSSPFTKRRASEGLVIYQLLLSGKEPIASIIKRLDQVEPAAIDLNLACPAPLIRKSGRGMSLFGDPERLRRVLGDIRSSWNGILTVKCRLGHDPETWQQHFEKRLRLFEGFEVDALHVHPRFFGEKLKRTARHHLVGWIVRNTSIPVVANGDITPESLRWNGGFPVDGVSGIMLGRMAAVKPWVFLECLGQRPEVDYAEVWGRFFAYVQEDFPPERAIGRIKEFSAYYARNFFYGHEFLKGIQNTSTLEEAYERGMRFLDVRPRIVAQPSVAGM